MIARLCMEMLMRERTKHMTVATVVLCVLIGGIWCFNGVLVPLGMASGIHHRGGEVSKAPFYLGTVLVSLSAPVGMLVAGLTRRRRSVWASVAIGVSTAVIAMVIGCAAIAIAVRLS